MRARAFGLTDVGRRRESNEDEFLVEPALDLYAVADGMGGHAAGEVASRLAVDALREWLSTQAAGGGGDPVRRAAEQLLEAVRHANVKICDSVHAHIERRGMGTTLVALLVRDRHAIIGHVGDSRAYLLRNGTLKRLTSDHSWVNEQVKLGLLSDEAAQRHPMRNIVTRALGSRAEVAAEVREEGVQAGDVFLLCSDGLNTMLSDEEIAEVLGRHGSDPEAACRELVRRANDRGGEDNTTVVVLHVDAPPR
jgi:serine/threonine protein phosphatase PrpC